MKRSVSLLLNCALLLTLLAPTAVGVQARTDPQRPETETIGRAVDAPASLSGGEQLPPPQAHAPTALQEAVRQGTFPAQLAGPSGSIRPDRYGPHRNDPAEGIPDHAYSPFDERRNREYPCPSGGCEFIDGQVLIKLDPEVRTRSQTVPGAFTADSAFDSRLRDQGVQRLEPIFPGARTPRVGEMVVTPQGERVPKPDLTRWHRAIFSTASDVYQTAEALQADPRVAYAEPDYLRKPARSVSSPPLLLGPLAPAALPGPTTDPLYDQQWHLEAASIPAAWQWLEDNGYAAGGSRDVVVAVIDTGVDYNHPDLAANMWINAAEFYGTPGVDDDGNGYVDDIHGATVVSGQRSGDPQDDHGHGTHVAGIIAAQAGNSKGGVGVAYNVQIMAIKAAQYSGVLAASDIAEGIYYAVDKGADVINMSFGGYARSQVEEDALAVAFGSAVLVAAAGNDSQVNLPCPFGRDMYPAAYNWVLGVMAHAEYPDAGGDHLAGFSNYDCNPRDTHEYELMAPGVGIWSTLPNEQYAAWAGTSMAAPVVSGIAALARTRWSDKDVYSSRFIMGQIATTGPLLQAYTPFGEPPVFYHTPDAVATLTTSPQPELSYLQHWLFDTPDIDPINDDDGIVDAGETVDLAVVIRNHWGKAEPVTVTLEAWAESAVNPDPYVTMITDTVQYGAVGSFNWQDNGLIYDGEGAIVGVERPFRFTTDPNTPNDHLIPFRLTITARNGYDPDDPTLYTAESRFFLLVQRGIELPYIIDEDMTLTQDYYWLVSDASLIAAGATVTVTEGTQLQFFSADPDDPYAAAPTPYIQVEGALRVQGTVTEPVEIFTGLLWQGYPIQIRQTDGGSTTLRYARIANPVLGNAKNIYDGNGGGLPLDLIEYAYFSQDLYDCIWEFYYWLSPPSWDPFCWQAPYVTATSIKQSIFKEVGYEPGHPYLRMNSSVSMSLFDSAVMDLRGASEESVFLKNYKSQSRTYHDGDGVSCATTGRLNDGLDNEFANNAILNAWWDSNINRWMRFLMDAERNNVRHINNNYWATTSTTLIDAAIHDFYDDFNLGIYEYQPILTEPPETAYPFVGDVILSTATQPDLSGLHGPTPIIGAEPVTFTVTFNRDMDTAAQPMVSFGPDEPYTDLTVPGDWVDARTWQGTYTVTPVTGDGYQLVRVAGAVAADDPWLVTGNDAGRFRFRVETSGTAAMNLQATGGEGYVDLMWTQTDFDLLAGFNLYRATAADGEYARLNSSILPPDQRDYRDTDVEPGQPYYYKFTVVKTDMTESDFSNIATATPIDTIAPVIDHTPVTSAPSGLPLTINADVTDNVAVHSVTLFYRTLGGSPYSSRAMVHTTGDRYAATLEGSLVTAPGIEYYIEASDGINITRSGRPDYPHQVSVEDRPVVTGVTPNHGPTGGGTVVTLSGTNFKAGATVTFGGAACADVSVISGNQISCSTPPHFPQTVDVIVTNPDDQSGTLLRGFTYESDTAALGLPHTGGGQHGIVQVPLTAANVEGLAAASFTVTFDGSVLSAQDASTGNLTPGWSVVANVSTPGEIRVAMASPGGTTSGSGVLAYVEFDVVGAPGDNSALQLTNVSLNDGAIPVETADGSFQVDVVYEVAGAVRFWHDSADVPGVQLTLQGDRVYSAVSDATGHYTVTGAAAGDYTLTPTKSDDAHGISAYDASLVLQHDAGLITLTGHAATAADVNKSGAITAMDAFYILQKAVDLISLPFPGAGVAWDFDPAQRTYQGLSGDQTAQDFAAILLGDVSGNWSSAGAGSMADPLSGSLRIAASQGTTAALSLPALTALPGEQITIPVALALDSPELYSADIAVSYDPTVVSATAVAKGQLTETWTVASNRGEEGTVRVALAGATPIGGGNGLLQLGFQALGAPCTETNLALMRGDLNEGLIPAELVDGSIRICYPADFDCNGVVDVVDIQMVAGRWRCAAGDECFDPGYDVDGDGRITIVDIMQVAAEWGWSCH